MKIREEGVNRVVIELPGSAAASGRTVESGLESEMGTEDVALYLETKAEFQPVAGEEPEDHRPKSWPPRTSSSRAFPPAEV